MATRIRKGDLVQVIAGSDRGKQGRVIAVDGAAGRVRVERVRIQKRHRKPGRGGNRSGGIVEQEGFVHVSNVQLVDPSTGKPARARVRVEGDQRTRVFARSGAPVPVPAAR